MNKLTDYHVDKAFQSIREVTDFQPVIALVLGSGLGSFVDRISIHQTINASDIPHYPVGSVQGHAGNIVFGFLEAHGRISLPLLLFQGRVHYYEIGDVEQVVFPIDLARRLGVRTLIVTNAAGGINTNFVAGQLMLIRDHLNFARKYPRTKDYGRPIPTKSSRLDPVLQNLIREVARNLRINLEEGTYCWLHGPSYETASEIKMLRTLGVDAVGMSTAPEIYRATSFGMRVAGISLISNMATGLSPTRLSHEEVTTTADKAQLSFSRLMKEFVLRIR